MAKYRLTHKAHLEANGNPLPRLFKAGDVINFDGVPSRAMSPLDQAAIDAIAARDAARGFKMMKNGIQTCDLAGLGKVARQGERGPPR